MKRCPKCDAKVRVSNTRCGSSGVHQHLIDPVSSVVGPVPFVARRRRCTECRWSSLTVELALVDLKTILRRRYAG